MIEAIIRSNMKRSGVGAYILTGYDPHINEYSAEYFNTRRFVSGFTGSAGVVIITPKNACLITDGRYTIQAKSEVYKGFNVITAKTDLETELILYLKKLNKKTIIGTDYKAMPYTLHKKISACGFSLQNEDFITEFWEERPPFTLGKVYSAKMLTDDTRQKLKLVREKINEHGGGAYLITAPEDTAWLFNIRGSDIPFTPIPFAYSYITQKNAYLFINTKQISEDIKQRLKQNCVTLYKYDYLTDFAKRDAKNLILIDKNRVNTELYYHFYISGNSFKQTDGIAAELKTIKNKEELKNTADYHIKDGAAVTRFILWLKENILKKEIYEHDINNLLFSYRKQIKGYISPSFQTIAAYMENAAQMHYSPKSNASAKILPNGILLIDSGAVYDGGVTDITRTIVIGSVSDEIKRDFTFVLKAHIALISLTFPENTAGNALDAIARACLWRHGMEYNSGTGHGIGLCVHEPPARISKTSSYPIKKGMVITVEPGCYKEGKYGIRTENAAAVTKAFENENGCFLQFTPLTLCPIDLECIIPDMLTSEEKAWLNAYHDDVYKKISPLLDGDENKKLLKMTKPI